MPKIKKCSMWHLLTEHVCNQMFSVSSFRPISNKRMNRVARMRKL